MRTMLFFGRFNEKPVDLIEYAFNYVWASSLHRVCPGHNEDNLLIIDRQMQGMRHSSRWDRHYLYAIIKVCGAQFCTLKIYDVMLVMLKTTAHLVQQSSYTRVAVGLIIRNVYFLAWWEIEGKL